MTVAVLRANQPAQAPRILGLAIIVAVCIAALPILDAIRVQTSVDTHIPDPIIGSVGIAGAIVAGFSGLFGDVGTSLIVGLVVAWLLTVGRQLDAVLAVAAFLTAEVLSRVAKLWFDAPRPYLLGDEAFSVAGVPAVFVLGVVAALGLVAVVYPGWRRPAIFGALSIALLLGASVVVDRIAPSQPGIDGFPSGHATGSMAAAAIATVVTWRTKVRWLVVIVGAIAVLGVAASRLYLDAHYPADLLGGWCVAIASVDIAWLGAMVVAAIRPAYRPSPR
jgi:membrane-associated phospholipid phosphatase